MAGAYGEDETAGAAYVFRFDDSVNDWPLEQRIKASNAKGTIGLAGRSRWTLPEIPIAVGAPQEDSESTGVGSNEENAPDLNANFGAAYIFEGTAP